MTTRLVIVTDASKHTSFRRTFTSGTLLLHYGEKDVKCEKDAQCDKDVKCDKEIVSVEMVLQWEGLRLFGNPPIEGRFSVGDKVRVFTGKCLPHNEMEDVGGVILSFEFSKLFFGEKEEESVLALIGGVRHFVFDIRRVEGCTP